MKKVSKVQWHGAEIKDGQAVPPVLAKDENDLAGLHEGEIYVSTAEEDPAFFIRTNRGNLAKFEKITISQLRKLFLSKEYDDKTAGSITFEKDITVKGLAKTLNLEVEQLATIARCVVDIISSPVFVDGFFGEGFQIWKSLVTGDWNMTIDRLTVRKVFSVFELLVQKLRSVGGMLVVSAADGKIETVERVGDTYEITFASGNGFQANDLIRHQVFSGGSVDYYWVEVTAVDGSKVIIPVSEFEGIEPQVGDECVLMGNTKNKLRQSLITISAVEDGQPRVDVLSGVNSKSFAGKLVTRVGNMDGIKDVYFPADNQPHGDGLYGINCYLRGTFLLVTGEDVLTKFLVMENMFRSEMENLRNEIQEKDNYFSNSAFASSTDKWKTTNDIRFFTVGNKFLYFNSNFYSEKKQVADIIKLSTRSVLRIKASGILQTNANLARKPKYQASDGQGNETAPKFFVSFRVRVLDHGVLTIGFPGQGLYHTETLEPTDEFIQKEYSGTWDGTGDFEMKFTGDAYFYSLALTDNAFEEMYTKFSTKIEQTNEKIELLATATSEMGDKLQSSIEVTAEKVELVSGKTDSLGNELRSSIAATAEKVELVSGKTDSLGNELRSSIAATAEDISLVSNKTDKLGNTLTSMGIVIDGNNGNISQFVKKDGVISSINQTSESVSIDASKINLNGAVSVGGYFRIDDKTGKMFAVDGDFSGNLNGVAGTFKELSAIDEINGTKVVIDKDGFDYTSDNGIVEYVKIDVWRENENLPGYSGRVSIFGAPRGVNANHIEITDSRIAYIIGNARFILNEGGLFFYDRNGTQLNSFRATGSKVKITAMNQTSYDFVTAEDCYLSCYNTGDLTVTLPYYPSVGTRIEVRRINSNVKVISDNFSIIKNEKVEYITINRGDIWMFVYDGVNWLANFIGYK